MEPRTYRTRLFLPLSGVFGVLFWGYAILYELGIAAWATFPRADHSELETMGYPLFSALVIVPCVLLIATVRFKATLSSEGIWYRGFLCSRRLGWQDITCIHCSKGLGMHVYADGRRFEILYLVARGARMEEDIVTFAHTYAPHAAVTKRAPPFWPRGRHAHE